MRHLAACFLAVSVAAVAISEEPPAVKGDARCAGPVIAAVSRQHIYAYATRKTQSGTDETSLVKFNFRGKETAAFAVGGVREPGVPYRWRIAFGCFWGAGMRAHHYPVQATRIPVADFDLFALPTTRAEIDAGIKRRYNRTGYVFPYNWSLNSLKLIADASGIDWAETPILVPDPDAAKQPVHLPYDMLPISYDACRMFVLHRRYMDVSLDTAAEMKPDVAGYGVYTKPIERFRADFDESFHVFGNDEAYFFVTESGKLYVANKSAGGIRTTRVVWDDSEERLATVIHDADTGTVFLFKGGEHGLPMFFEIRDGKGSQHFYDVPPGLSTMKEPLNKVFECVRILVAERMLTAG